MVFFPEYWHKHTDVQLVCWIQGKTGKEEAAADDEDSDFTSSASEEVDDERKTNEVDNHLGHEVEQETDSEPEDSDSNAEFGVCNKFSVLGAGD
jgi:hypothetical protein